MQRLLSFNSEIDAKSQFNPRQFSSVRVYWSDEVALLFFYHTMASYMVILKC